MELEIPEDCREWNVEVLQTLINIKTQLFDQIVGQLMSGECSYLSGGLYGYPYDYELYSKDSLDPMVQKLNGLLEMVEQTFVEIVGEG